MSGLQLNTLTAAGSAAANTVASALLPKKALALNSAAATSPTTTSTSSTATTASTGNITSSDFLTLLVSELMNQDPTPPTDPNAYITQNAQVNSLQQLIDINTGIGTLDNSVTTTGTTATTGTTGH